MGMLTTVIGAAANIALDPLFIFVFRMDVAGAALATVLSQFLSFAFVVTFLLWKNTKIRIALGKCDFKLIGKIVRLGISPFLIMATDSAIIIVSNAILQARGGLEGDLWITVSTVVQAFFQLITMPMMGISTGSQPVISYNYGAKNTALIKKAEKYIVGLCLLFTTAMTVVSLFAAGPFVSLFTSNAEIAERSVWGIRVFMLGVIPLSFQYAFVGPGLTALGQPAVCPHPVADAQARRFPRLSHRTARLLGRAGGVLRRACGGHLFRDFELRRLFNRIPEDIEKAGGRAARSAKIKR